MPKPGKKRRFIVLSIFLSIGLHLLLFAFLAGVRFDLHGLTHAKATPPPPRRMQIQSVDLHKLVFEQNHKKLAPAGVIGFQDPNKNVRRLFEKMDLLPKPPPVAELAGLGKNVVMPESRPAPTPQMPAAPPVKIVEIDAARLAAGRIQSRELTPKIDRVQLLGDRVPGLTGAAGEAGSGETVRLGMRLGGSPDIPLRADELDSLTANANAITPVTPVTVTERNRTSGNLDNLVTVSMTVYEPEGKNGGYFRIDIAPNTASNRLRSIPKDILFLLDCSASISTAKLEQFKTGVLQLLPQLRGTDRFNIIAFRDQGEMLFIKPVPVSDMALKTADAFVRQQVHGGLTDVYSCLAPIVNNGDDSAAEYRPLNIFLLSDGQSTVRNKLDNDTFIRNVVNARRNHVSIYSFSAGTRANLFLMDLLAYSNRGDSMFVASVSQFSGKMVEFIQEHTDLIVADLRYHATGELASEIFPRQLPHLYRGQTLCIYGKYPAGTASIGMQFLGRNADGKEEELVFTGDLRSAPRGDSAIKAAWAGQKIITLLVDRVMDPKAHVTDEIRRLAQENRIPVPYL